jgi:hypothetical protein
MSRNVYSNRFPLKTLLISKESNNICSKDILKEVLIIFSYMELLFSNKFQVKKEQYLVKIQISINLFIFNKIDSSTLLIKCYIASSRKFNDIFFYLYIKLLMKIEGDHCYLKRTVH